MGHLSRQLSTIISAGSTIRPVIFSLSGALPRIISAVEGGELSEASGFGVSAEYCPSRESGWPPPSGWRRAVRERYRSYRWHEYLRDRLIAFAAEVGASALVFDGVVPYRGLLEALEALPEMKSVWVRRGMWQNSVPTERLGLSRHFDLAIEPGDFAQKYDLGPTASRDDVTRTAPVSLTHVLEKTAQAEARHSFGLASNKPAILVAPGSGALGSTAAMLEAVIAHITTKFPDWQITVTKQAISRHGVEARSNVVVLDDVYPLARHLGAFDAAISAAGYNAAHEFLAANVPTLFVPSRNHVTDDQVARAEGLEKLEVAQVASDNLEASIDTFLAPDNLERLAANCRELPAPSGSDDIARLVTSIAATGNSAPHTDIAAPKRPLIDLRTRVNGPGQPELVFSERAPQRILGSPNPLEHLLVDASPDYVAQREKIARWLYRGAW